MSKPELVWQNECRLVFSGKTARCEIGQMGLCHSSGEEIQIDVYSHDDSGQHEIFNKLKDVPVRITIERVPGGRA